MFPSISEPDWKLFRRLQPIALDRFCQRVLAEINRVAEDADKSNHERYLTIFNLIKHRDKELSDAFDNPRRSSAVQQLACILLHGLLTADEISGFSAETRRTVQFLLGTEQEERC
jgi:hypothetical protein